MSSEKKFIAWVGIALISAPVWADTVMMPPPPKQKYSDSSESFPESRFGYPPQRVNTGVSENYAAHETIKYDNVVRADEWDGTGPQTDRALAESHPYARATRGEAPSRAPAGLQFGSPNREVAANEPAKASGGPASSRNLIDGPAGPGASMPSPEAEEMAIRKKGVQEIAVIAGDLGYFPKTVFVTRDIPVRLFVTGASKNTLCIMMDSFQVRKQVRSQRIEEITFTPSLPGQYRFYCPVNGMEGTMVVRDVTS